MISKGSESAGTNLIYSLIFLAAHFLIVYMILRSKIIVYRDKVVQIRILTKTLKFSDVWKMGFYCDSITIKEDIRSIFLTAPREIWPDFANTVIRRVHHYTPNVQLVGKDEDIYHNLEYLKPKESSVTESGINDYQAAKGFFDERHSDDSQSR